MAAYWGSTRKLKKKKNSSSNKLRIVIATKNQGKVREMKEAFRELPVELVSLVDLPGSYPDAVEDGTTFWQNAYKKACHYHKLTGLPCLADDSGLEVEALGGAPGVYSARFAGENASDEDNNKKLLQELARRGLQSSPAAYQCSLVLVFDDCNIMKTQGTCRGEIRTEGRGTNGFGYDPYFYVGEKTMAEMTLAEKQAVSHRGEALRNMADSLQTRFDMMSGRKRIIGI